ncbi:hypothetical protein [Crassaminicella profunda]|uniref:hypothetical protein n=1 Tax=Crassaminicella profunda TaxID=1286698 RepID=UPI001CA693D2|nr:hypothetical protein [Crassaminicella profunda]QZY56937.1 hypothetical protein K7H06_08460 [Crassaminicella profunda]
MQKDNKKDEQRIDIIRNSVDPGAVEDIYGLKYREQELKSGSIAGTENQINTAGATSSSPGTRE